MVGRRRTAWCLAACAVALALGAAAAAAAGTKPFVGGYILVNGAPGLAKLTALARAAKTLPVTRLFIAFFSPTMVYATGSNTLANTGLDVGVASGDHGFAQVKAVVGQLSECAAGV
jgi:hypothetical protein